MPYLNRFLILVGIVLLAASLWFSHALPAPQRLQAALQEEPEQHPVSLPAFDVDAGDTTYTVQPLFRYELSGLVVSRHNADAWWDFIHRESHDALNVTDLCVVWGENLRRGVYQRLKYWSGQFTCFVEADSAETAALFDTTALSNNHLLTGQERLAKLMRRVEVGDQIHLAGYLAEYSHNHGFAFRRGTSTTRTDTGNGACETIYVEEFSILRQGGNPWRMLRWLGAAMCLAGMIGWALQPLRFRD